jgi:hypothetical protein
MKLEDITLTNKQLLHGFIMAKDELVSYINDEPSLFTLGLCVLIYRVTTFDRYSFDEADQFICYLNKYKPKESEGLTFWWKQRDPKPRLELVNKIIEDLKSNEKIS